MKTVNVRIKYGGQVMAYECCGHDPVLGDWVVVKNGEVTYLGQVVTAPIIMYKPSETEEAEGGEGAETEAAESLPQRPEDQAPLAAPEAPPARKYPGGRPMGRPPRTQGFENRRVLRLATEADMARQAENEVREKEAFDYCLARVAFQRLEMKLVAVEVVFDGSKTIFYYTAEERVDFRLLVKELVSRFRTRIEMRQIGVRHEARMIGGLGACGRGFCCAGFLSNFAPVSVKMAKEQNISLSPSKISGVCGRLMCCLAFEHYGPFGGRGKGRPAPPLNEAAVAEMNEEEIARLAD